LEIEMQGILYEEPSVLQFFFVTCLLGGWAAWMTGRASAQTWRPMSSLIVFLLLLGIAVRFIHHALFSGTMFTAQYYWNDRLPVHTHEPDGDAISLALRKGFRIDLEAQGLTFIINGFGGESA